MLLNVERVNTHDFFALIDLLTFNCWLAFV